MNTVNGTLLESEKYHVIRELGRGGMGVVYLAEDRQLRRRVALKVLYDYLNRDKSFVERFQEEACSVSTLHHPNIVCVHGLDRTGEIVAIDMEFVEGVSLDQVTVITPHIAAAIARDVLGGLAACHQIGVVHRDIKPSNILVNQMGQAKITDFGLATAYVSHIEATMPGSTSSGFYMGTPRYMPIQAWEGNDPEPFWDLYSFGVVLHELVSGRSAFPGANPIEVMRKQLTESLPSLQSIDSNVSPEFSQLVDFLLSASRDRADEVSAVNALERLRKTPEYRALNEVDSVTTVALPPAALKKRKPVRKNRATYPWHRALPALGLALIIALAIYAVTLFSPDGDVEPTTAPVAISEPVPAAAVPLANDATTRFFNVSAINSDQRVPVTWMVDVDEAGRPLRFVALFPRELWSFTVGDEVSGNRRSIQGFWGGGLPGANRTGQHGTLDGSLVWEPGDSRIAAHVTRVRHRDNTATDFSFVGQLKDVPYDRSAFIRELEANSLLQGLLYRELLARALPWAVEVEAMMPALPGARALVPFVSETITTDGLLEEAQWLEPQFNASGRIGELSTATSPGDPKLLVRWSENGLHLGVFAPNCGASPRFEIGILPAPDVFAMESGRFFVNLSESDRIESRYVEASRERPWTCDWQGQVASVSGGANVELLIPIASLKENAEPQKGKRWRLNARLTSTGDDGSRKTDVVWGASEFEELEHGALLVFEQ